MDFTVTHHVIDKVIVHLADGWIVKDQGIDRLCEWHPEILEAVTDRIIDDKSKTGNFGKVVVCLQTLWFVAQCISRLAQSLPVTLLEVRSCAASLSMR
ncbi:hypothetical protein BKA65DRAFT_5629 [Rhexocercosporidium sp. MPI-PUGE-AT-0058]|nr:hypothetical protein BKA65DRAFT_5629 [Rhexocercosporidium sp. MPI-PUGE-AT-0058]